MLNTNEWFLFDAGTVDKKTCNKIKKHASKKWEVSGVDTSKETTDEERKTGKKSDYKPDPKTRISDIAWTNDQWLYDIIWPFMERANDEADYQTQYIEFLDKYSFADPDEDKEKKKK